MKIKKIIIFSLVVFLVGIVFSIQYKKYQHLNSLRIAIPNIDFNESMKTSSYSEIMDTPPWNLEGYSKTKEMLSLFHNLYEKNKPKKISVSLYLRIPKIIHQIWIGSEFPEKYKKFQKSWLDNHSNWQYRLWTDKDIESFKMKNKELFDKAENYGEKADIWRYEILERFGGLYVDTDFECFKPFDVLHHLYDFYAGIEPMEVKYAGISNALIGSKAHHPILQKCIEKLPHSFKKYPHTQVKTGPLFLTRVFLQYAETIPRIIGFPQTFFYPCCSKFDKPGIPDEAFAMHYYAGSWMK